MNLNIHSYDYLMNNSFDRIKDGKVYDNKLKTYSLDFIKELISFFEKKEEFEKCQLLIKFIERFDHDKNYK